MWSNALRRAAAPIVSVALLLAPAVALPYAVSLTNQNTGEVVRWFKSDVPFHLHPACSSDLPAQACLAECQASFQTWQGKTCSTLKMSYAGQSANTKLVAVGYNANGKNEVAWIENAAWSYGKYVLGVTSPYFYTSGPQTGHITEADIAMNGYLQSWSTSGKTYSTDVRNVLVHEIGHFFGLQHNLYPNVNNPETMAPTADPYMKSQTPEADDIAGLCYLYPASGKTTCSSNDDCPYVMVDTSQGEKYGGVIPCKGGSCGGQTAQVPPGSKKLGDPCANSSDCTTPLYCQPMSGSQAVCSQDCSPAAKNCPSGFQCMPFQNDPSKGACIKGSGPTPPTKDIGQPCTASSECKSNLCVNEGNGQFCRQPCTTDGQCPSGQKCSLFAGKNYGACFADDGPPPATKNDGEPCQSSGECKSNLCVGSGSSGECIKGCSSSSPCPAGYACMKLSSGAGGCFKAGTKKLGETCEAPSDCAGGLCAASEGKYVCSQPCSDAKPCPAGHTCYPLSGGGGGCFEAPAKSGDGAKCEYSSDCQSGLCVGSASDAKCVQPCTADKKQCGPGFLCVPLSGGGGACLPLGSKKAGTPCDKPTDCASGMCMGLGSSGFVCTQSCGKTADCNCGFECTTYQSGEKFCVAGKKAACVANGGGCSNDAECVSDICAAGQCATTCSIFSGGQTCPAGTGCVRLHPGKPEGACVKKGFVGFGGACTADVDCIGLFCHAGKCGKPCSPFLPNACTLGLVCNPANGDVGNCGAPTPPVDAGSTAATDGGGNGVPIDAGSVIEADAGGTGGGIANPEPPPEDDLAGLCSASRRGAPGSLAWPLLLAVGLVLGWRQRLRRV